jgi:hypothetical protein
MRVKRKITILNGPGEAWPDGCVICGINIAPCWTECGCEWYIPPCTDCQPVE